MYSAKELYDIVHLKYLQETGTKSKSFQDFVSWLRKQGIHCSYSGIDSWRKGVITTLSPETIGWVHKLTGIPSKEMPRRVPSNQHVPLRSLTPEAELTLAMQFLGCRRNPNWAGRYK